ncbi:MAG: NAD(P)-dependent oxidoreductase [Deltaproteobacteria bacterium]|nr:NAD(P)-dependent oxidoreductase [Deltaproteobacteria bacterium]MBW2360987.1 NAD(P)-dependent oxidoreductase [Deltaproteobacteria bacterium]
MLEGQRILVTGATGQVARTLAEQLEPNNEVWAAARFTDEKARQELEQRGIRTVFFSMGDEDLSGLPDVDYVFHAGANTDPQTPEIGMLHNAEGSGFLMQRYRDAKAFLHISSSSVYRVSPSACEPTREDHELGGHAGYSPHYAMSKLAAEAVVRFQARALSLPTLIARLDAAYGRCSHGGVPMILYEMMKAGMSYTRAESGDSYCSLIHEDDIAEQVQNLILEAHVPARIVNLGGDEVASVEEIIAYLEELTGLRMTIETAEQASWTMKILDNTLRKQLGGPCKVSWKDGVRRSLAARHPDAIID